MTATEKERAPTLLDEASDLVAGHLGCDPDPVPDPVKRVVARMVARVMLQDASGAAAVGVNQVSTTAGPFSRQMTMTDGAGSSSPWLERTDKLKLKPYRCGGGMVSVGLVSDQSGR